jgi:type I restriction enzyme S subunit
MAKESWPFVPLGRIIAHRKEFIQINDLKAYKRCRVQLHAQGIVLRDTVLGAEIKTKKQQVCHSGEFLVAEIDAKVGGFGIVPESLEEAIVSSHYFLFALDEESLDRRFLGYFIQTRSFRDQITAQGSTNYAAIRPEDVLGYKIPLPPLDEQRRIVARIEELASRIEEARELRRRVVEEVGKIYSSALAFLIRPQDRTWKHETVADIIESIDAGRSPQCGDRPARKGEWGVLKTTSVQWNDFRPNENKVLPPTLIPEPKFSVISGDVLVTRAGPRERVGVVATVRDEIKNLMISDKLIRLRPDSSKVDPRFLELTLSSSFSQEYLVRRKTGLADAQVNISQAILKSTPIAYPSVPEQIQVIEYLESLKSKLDALKRHQAKTTAALDALLPAVLERAFRGEL